MKTRLSILGLGIMLGLISCSVDDNPTDGPNDDYIYPKEPDYESVKCDVPVFVSEHLAPQVLTAVESYLTNMTTIENANVAVVEPEDIPVCEDKLVDLYNRGGLIVIARPTGEHYAEFASKYNIGFDMPIDPSQSILLFAFDNKQNCYVLFANGPFKGQYPDDDDVWEIDPGEPINEEAGPDEELEDEQTYNKRRIFEFFRWVKSERNKPAATRTTWVSVYNPYVYFKECQHITHNYEMSLNHKVCKVLGCKADYINVSSSIEVSYSIYAAYVFQCSENAGDYYIVSRTVTAHNGPLYAPFDKVHGVVSINAAGYYMKELEVTSQLNDSTGWYKLSDLQFCGDVTPITTVGSTDYTTGVNLGLSGAVSVGTNDAFSCGFNASYNLSRTRTISDLEIKKAADTDARKVTHNYIVKNNKLSGKNNGEYMYKGYKAMTKDVPLIARSDFDNTAEWCWRVPAGTNQVADSAFTKFKLYTYLDYKYGCYLVSNFNVLYGRTHGYEYTAGCIQSITPPSRVPFGILEFKNEFDNAIANICIYKYESKTKNYDFFTKIPSSYLQGDTAKCVLPTGYYRIAFDQMNTSTNKVDSSWQIDNVLIKNARTEKGSTTSVSTIYAIKKE